ncbi:MAG: TonB-dependent receptor [Thalassotalea sp.]
MTNKNTNLKRGAIISGSTCLLMALGAPSVLAQEVKAAIESKKAAPEAIVEVIEVTGVRSSLEAALNIKRNAPSIVDAISATDINALPALDLGEALQAIPGIQLNREAGQRQSEINLRGLSGGFVKTTAAGQSFATPSRSSDSVGSSNPFGAFEAGVFDGITVVKTPTADLQEGGIAGVVDKQLQRALAKKDGQYSVSLGGRYEELRDGWDKEFKLSATKHIIKDELAVAVKIAGSEQNFRRDTANFSTYAPLDTTNFPGLPDYLAEHNIPDGSIVKAVSAARNVTEASIGDRISATANIEWQATEALKLGAHVLYTERDLNKGNHEDTVIGSGYNGRNPARSSIGYGIVPKSAPFLLSTAEDGTKTYAASSVELINAHYTPANRIFNFLETSEGVFLYGDYVKDNWVIDATATYSESENRFEQNAFDVRHQGVPHPRNEPTGISATIDTANGNLSKAMVDIQGWDNYDYSGDWSETTLTGFSSNLDKATVADRSVSFFAHGAVDNPVRQTTSAEFNALRYLDFDLGFGEALKFSSVKFGGRYSNENLDNYRRTVGVGGLDFSAAVDGNPFDKTLFSDTQTSFFNGNYNGAFNSSNGWQSINAEALREALVATRTDVEGGFVIQPSGLYARNVGPHPDQFAANFEVDQAIMAAYVMTNFEGEVGSVFYSGNVGLRYVETENTFNGLNRVQDEIAGTDILVAKEHSQKYDNLLPSFNLSVELTDDVVLRAAYSEGIVRPNLRSQTPTLGVNPGNARMKIDLPASEVEPYTADNYDLSVEWYNREGSAISVGIFQKNITNLFSRESLCPVGEDLSQYSTDLGEIESFFNPGDENEKCREVDLRLTDEGEEVQREVIINRSFNNDSEIKVTGYELAVQQKLDFLPYPYNGFGGVFNYTYITQDTDGEESLYKIAPKSYNIIGYYENDGYSVRLAYNWRDNSILEGGSQFLGDAQRTQKAGGRLDLSASYTIQPGLVVRLQGYNLNDEQRYEYIGDNEAAVSRVDYTGRTFQLGVSYSF